MQDDTSLLRAAGHFGRCKVPGVRMLVFVSATRRPRISPRLRTAREIHLL